MLQEKRVIKRALELYFEPIACGSARLDPFVLFVLLVQLA